MVDGESCWHTLAHIKVEYENTTMSKNWWLSVHNCSLALCCEDALRFFDSCFPHIWVSTAQQPHWCWSFSWLRWQALPTPERESLPDRELPSLSFSNYVTSPVSEMHLLPCNLLPIQVFCCVLRIPAILPGAMPAICQVLLAVLCFFLECAMSKWKHDVGEAIQYVSLMDGRQKSAARGCNSISEADRKLFRTIRFLLILESWPGMNSHEMNMNDVNYHLLC